MCLVVLRLMIFQRDIIWGHCSVCFPQSKIKMWKNDGKKKRSYFLLMYMSYFYLSKRVEVILIPEYHLTQSSTLLLKRRMYILLTALLVATLLHTTLVSMRVQPYLQLHPDVLSDVGELIQVFGCCFYLTAVPSIQQESESKRKQVTTH